MYTFEHECLGDNCVYCALVNQFVERLDRSTQLIITTLRLDPDELRELMDSFYEQPLNPQIVSLLNIDYDAGFPNNRPEGLSDELWAILQDADDEGIPHSLRLCNVSMLLFILEMDNALFYLSEGHLEEAISSYGEACTHFGEVTSLISATYGKGSSHMVAKLGAEGKLKSDPKQAAKAEVFDCWKRWQKNQHEYKSKSAFAKAMMDKYEPLESQRVIERWCKNWEAELSQQST